MDHPLVSVGVPVYNGEKWIHRSMDSLLKQDYPNIEIIVSDNASDDATSSICDAYKRRYDRISIIRQEKMLDVIDNFNAVLNQAKGKYFMWAAVDDLWESSFVSQLVGKLESDAAFAVAQSAIMNVSESGLEKISYVQFDGANNPEKCTALQLTKKIVSPLKYNFYIYGVFRRDLLVEAFRYCPRIPSSDRWFLLQFPLAGYKFAYVDEPLYIRTIADQPLYLRYPNEPLGENVKKIQLKYFDLSPILAVYKMILRSSIVSWRRKFFLPIVLAQIIFRRVERGMRMVLRPYLIRFLPVSLQKIFLRQL